MEYECGRVMIVEEFSASRYAFALAFRDKLCVLSVTTAGGHMWLLSAIALCWFALCYARVLTVAKPNSAGGVYTVLHEKRACFADCVS